MLAVSEAERQAMTQNMEHEKTIFVDSAQEQTQHAEGNVAGATDAAQRRLAQEEIEILNPYSQQKAKRGKAECREEADAARIEG
eukprot:2479490-Pyramimonas_sp.AAC.1